MLMKRITTPTIRGLFPTELKFDSVIFREIAPQYFDFLVRIYNDQKILGASRSITQKVTLESQKKWYEAYLERDERYYIVTRASDGRPIGTNSFNYLDPGEMNLIAGRLVYDKNATDDYRRYLFDHAVGMRSYVFDIGIKRLYAYVKKGNIAAEKFVFRSGYYRTDEIKYRDYLGQQQNEFNEYILTKENFYAAKEKFASIYLSRQDLNQ